jgi:methylmalonyl-CoA mutase
VRKQWRRNHVAFELAEDDVPVYPTIASQFNDPGAALSDNLADASLLTLRRAYNRELDRMGSEAVGMLEAWPARAEAASGETYQFKVRERQLTGANYTETMSHSRVPKLAIPKFKDWGELLHFLGGENLPGSYPYTGGVYAYRREAEDPIRMFAGEGTPERTNRRFHYVARGQPATRLSTAFDSTTLYGEDPDTRPDIYGRCAAPCRPTSSRRTRRRTPASSRPSSR